jgi:hypothetical protein
MDRIIQEVLEYRGIQFPEPSSKLLLSMALLNINKTDYKTPFTLLEDIASQQETASYIGLHDFEGTRYFNKENFDTYMDWQFTFGAIESAKTMPVKASISKMKEIKENSIEDKIKSAYDFYNMIKEASEKVNYKFDDLIKLLKEKVPSHGNGIDKLPVSTKAPAKKGINSAYVLTGKTITAKKVNAKKDSALKKEEVKKKATGNNDTAPKSMDKTKPGNKKKKK